MSGGSLQPLITERLAQRRSCGDNTPILLMAHLVLGYPSLAENEAVIASMAAAGVELIELQIPFSEPVADGPVIARANQDAINLGFKVRDGLEFIAKVTARYSPAFLIMTYYNILLAYGEDVFIREVARIGVRGLIVPDLPLEEATSLIALCREQGIDWIQIMTPTSDDVRLRQIGVAAQGFCYCVARKGVTGRQTDFRQGVVAFLERCRQATTLPLAVGFGVQSAADVMELVDMAQIAVVGTAALEIQRRGGAAAVGDFFAGLR